MAWDNIQDLYNQQLAADKTLVDEIIAEIKTEIERKVDEKEEYFFEYDLEETLVGYDNISKQRIRDQVVFIIINLGIKCTADTKLYIKWSIRDNREYMKAYF